MRFFAIFLALSKVLPLVICEGDLLSGMLHHMETVERSVMGKKDGGPGCPYLLSDYNVSLPEALLSAQLSSEIRAVQHLVRLFNGFLDNAGMRDGWDESRLGPLAQSAARVLLETQPRLSGTHFCWLTAHSAELSVHSTACRFFFFSWKSAGAGSHRDQLQSIRDNQRNVLPWLAQIWPHLTAASPTLANHSAEKAAWTGKPLSEASRHAHRHTHRGVRQDCLLQTAAIFFPINDVH
jgi:hypothetical protein